MKSAMFSSQNKTYIFHLHLARLTKSHRVKNHNVHRDADSFAKIHDKKTVKEASSHCFGVTGRAGPSSTPKGTAMLARSSGGTRRGGEDGGPEGHRCIGCWQPCPHSLVPRRKPDWASRNPSGSSQLRGVLLHLPRAGSCLLARANPHVSTGDFFGDGGIKSKQVGPSGWEGQVTAVLPDTFAFFILRAWYIL